MKPFGLAKKQLRTFSDPVLEYLPAFFDRGAVADAEYEDLESLAQLSLANIVAERIAKLGVGLPPEQMTEKLLFNDGTRAVVSGFRFLNLDLKSPFVALKANFRINEAETARLLKSLVMKTYGESDPLGFTVWEQPGLDLGQTENWSVVVAGETDIAPPPDPPAGLELKWVSSIDSFVKDMKREYADWSKDNAALARFVTMARESELATAASKGHALALYDSTGWAGLITGDRSLLFGCEALRITEFFIARRWRYRGLGKMLEAAFLEKLKADFNIVWGTIHRKNEPSLRTALALGRMPLQQEYFFSLSSD